MTRLGRLPKTHGGREVINKTTDAQRYREQPRMPHLLIIMKPNTFQRKRLMAKIIKRLMGSAGEIRRAIIRAVKMADIRRSRQTQPTSLAIATTTRRRLQKQTMKTRWLKTATY